MAIIEVDGLVKRYGGRTAVDGVSFAVEAGEIFGILEPNGAGKTTTVECVEGLRKADGGSIRVCGIDPQRGDRALRQVLGAQLQRSELPDKLRVGEAMELYSSFYRDPADWRELIETLGLTGKLDAQSGGCPAGRSSACRSRSRWSATRGWRSSTRSPRAWTRRRAATRGTSSTASAAGASRSCSSRTSWRRRSGSATGSR